MKGNTKDKKWYALYVSSRSEKKVMEALLAKGIEAYVPLMKTMRQWSDRKKLVELPLFNGYVFVHIDGSENALTLQTKNVVNFVRLEGKPGVIRDVEIEQLKQLTALGYQMERAAIKRNYKEGDKVKITSGVLKNIEGFVTEHNKGRLIEVLLESIGQCITVKLPEELLISAKA